MNLNLLVTRSHSIRVMQQVRVPGGLRGWVTCGRRRLRHIHLQQKRNCYDAHIWTVRR